MSVVACVMISSPLRMTFIQKIDFAESEAAVTQSGGKSPYDGIVRIRYWGLISADTVGTPVFLFSMMVYKGTKNNRYLRKKSYFCQNYKSLCN